MTPLWNRYPGSAVHYINQWPGIPLDQSAGKPYLGVIQHLTTSIETARSDTANIVLLQEENEEDSYFPSLVCGVGLSHSSIRDCSCWWWHQGESGNDLQWSCQSKSCETFESFTQRSSFLLFWVPLMVRLLPVLNFGKAVLWGLHSYAIPYWNFQSYHKSMVIIKCCSDNGGAVVGVGLQH